MKNTLAGAVAAFEPGLPLGVAYSGGADSTALLLACARKWPGQVTALHVHHGLQAAADEFVVHCESFCAELGVPLRVARVDARHTAGQSPEDAARRARYAAISVLANDGCALPAIKNIALAQHADDQVETLLLALSRGAGLPGLASMAAHRLRGGLVWHRPLLSVSAASIRQWLQDQGARFVEDPTNSDERFTRNRVRARLLPVLEATFPHFRDTFSRSAAHAAQAREILDEVAASDLLAVGVPPSISRIQGLSLARQANVLRHWLLHVHGCTPQATQIRELQRQIAACKTRGHRIQIKVATGMVRRTGPCIDWSAV